MVAFNARRRHQETLLGYEMLMAAIEASFARLESTELTARATSASPS